MASIAKRPNGQWRARYRDDTGKEHSRHFTRKVDAQSWLDQVTTAIVTGQYVDPKAGKTTLRSYSDGWEAAQVASAATARITDNALRLHILPNMGDRPMSSIRPSDVQAWVKGLSQKLSPGSVRNIYDVLARVFSAAVEDRVVALSPCRKIKLPQMSSEEVTPPTVDEVIKVVEAMPDELKAAAVLLSGSGLRIGEMLGLKVADIDFLRRTVDELAPEFGRQHRARRGLREHASANAIAGLEHDRAQRGTRQAARGCQARGTGTDDDDVGVH